jgi:hypothetical protein
MADAFGALVRQLEATSPSDVGSGPRAVDDGRDGVQTQVTVRLARSAAPRSGEEDVEAFVERAFHAMVAPPDAPSDPPPPLVASVITGPETTARSPRADDAPRSSRPPESTIPLLRRNGAAPRPAEPRGEPAAPAKPRPPPLPRRAVAAAAPVIAIERERRDPAAQSGDRWLAPVGQGVVATLIDEGFTALRRGERDTARRVWREALGLDPNNRMLELNLRRLDALGAGRE